MVGKVIWRSREVSDITKILEFTQKQVEDETKVIINDIETLQKKLNEVEKDLLDSEEIKNKLAYEVTKKQPLH